MNAHLRRMHAPVRNLPAPLGGPKKQGGRQAWCPMCRGWDGVLRAAQAQGAPDPESILLIGYVLGVAAGPNATPCAAHRWVIERAKQVVKRAGW